MIKNVPLRSACFLFCGFSCPDTQSSADAKIDKSDLIQVLKDGSSLLLTSISSLLKNQHKREFARKILRDISLCISITLVLNLPFLALWCILRRRRALRIKIALTFALILSSITARMLHFLPELFPNAAIPSYLSILGISIKGVDLICTLLLIRLVRSLMMIYTSSFENYANVVIGITKILSTLLTVKYIILFTCYLGNLRVGPFLERIADVQYVILLCSFLIASAAFKAIEGNNKYWINKIFSLCFMFWFSSRFIPINNEGALWLFLTYLGISYIRNWALLALYSLIKFLPNYPTSPYSNAPAKGKLPFIKSLIFLRDLSQIFLVPMSLVLYLRFFNIFILSKISGFLGYGVTKVFFTFGISLCSLLLLIMLTDYISVFWAKSGKNVDFASEERAVVFAKIFSNILSVVYVIAFLFFVPYVLGLQVSAVFTALSLIISALSFAMRDLINDIIQGMLFHYDGTVKRGDMIYISNIMEQGMHMTGKTENVVLRYLQLRLDNGTLITVPFRHIGYFGNKSRIFSQVVFNTSFSHAVSYSRTKAILEKAFAKLKETPEIYKHIYDQKIQIRGVTEITSFSYIVQYYIKTAPSYDEMVRRAMNEVLLDIFINEEPFIPAPVVANADMVPSVHTRQLYAPQY